jgi:hypothetical protein
MYNGVHVLGSMKNMVLNARWAQEKNYWSKFFMH